MKTTPTVNTNFTKMLKQYERKWVALSSDRSKVVASNENLVKLSKRVKGKDVVYMKVPPSNTAFAF